MMRPLEAAFEPAPLGPVTVPNRVIKSATYEGMSPGGIVSDDLVRHHERLARGGVGLTTVAYGAVTDLGRTFGDQLVVDERNAEGLRRLTGAVHDAGAAACIQLSHAGFFTKLRSRAHGWGSLVGVRGPSWGINAYGVAAGVPLVVPLTHDQLDAIVDDFRRAARFAVDCGFDALELHLGHGYLLSQFISPATNRRRDEYGGDLDGRMRFPLRVVRAVLDAVGDRVAVIAKHNLDDGFAGGLKIDEAVGVARRLEDAGVHGLVLSGGFTSKSPFFLLRGDRPLDAMVAVEKSALQRVALRTIGPWLIRAHPFAPTFFLDLAKRVRAATQLPLALLGGIVSVNDIQVAMAAGFDFVAMGRALLADPDLIARFEAKTAVRTRCTACNRCVAEMDAGGVRCVLPNAEGPS